MLGMDINPNTILIANRDRDPNEVDPEGRKRRLCNIWRRIPDGRYLEKDQAPVGHRTPNGLVWGHTLDELGLIERDPGLPIYTQYSRSQLKELGENYDDADWDGEPLVRPRVKRPWPVLKLPKRHPANTTPPVGAIDGGCDEEHDEDCTYTVRWDEFSDDRKGKTTPRLGQPPPACSTDPANLCTGCWISNDPSTGTEGDVLRTPTGYVYDYVWCEHFAVCAREAADPCFFLGQKTHDMIWEPRIFADFTGVLRFDGFGEWHKFLPPGALDSVPEHLKATADERTGESGAAHPKTSGLHACRALPFSFSVTDLDPEDEEFYYRARASGFNLTKVDGKGKATEAPGLFSLKDLPKLEEFIPEGLFPDVLLVHDPAKLTNHAQPGSEPVKYKRLFPALARDNDLDKDIKGSSKTENVAHLHLHKTNRLGEGHHSYVYRAPLTLPPPLSARSHTGQCTVAAKLAFPHCTAHALLANEGKVYSELPKHTQEEYCGFNIAPPCNYPVPVGAIAPKFFGYYVPVGEDGEAAEGYGGKQDEHEGCSESRPCKVAWASPILLMEECGTPVRPEKFSADERTECFSLLHRLHKLNIVQGSFYVRNVLIQPGPLTDAPERRSLDTPSFRIIDFGRGEVYAEHAGMTHEERERARDTFAARIRDEQKGAREQMLLEYPCGF